jgi:hypothetical protein
MIFVNPLQVSPEVVASPDERSMSVPQAGEFGFMGYQMFEARQELVCFVELDEEQVQICVKRGASLSRGSKELPLGSRCLGR